MNSDKKIAESQGSASRAITMEKEELQVTAKKHKKLTSCPVCNASISKHAHFCPSCGEPDPLNHLLRANWLSRTFWFIVIIAIIYFGYTVAWPMVVEMIKDL